MKYVNKIRKELDSPINSEQLVKAENFTKQKEIEIENIVKQLYSKGYTTIQIYRQQGFSTKADWDWLLDPFMGSGSTGKAAMLEGFRFIGMEIDKDYFHVARKRVKYARVQFVEDSKKPRTLFD